MSIFAGQGRNGQKCHFTKRKKKTNKFQWILRDVPYNDQDICTSRQKKVSKSNNNVQKLGIPGPVVLFTKNKVWLIEMEIFFNEKNVVMCLNPMSFYLNKTKHTFMVSQKKWCVTIDQLEMAAQEKDDFKFCRM